MNLLSNLRARIGNTGSKIGGALVGRKQVINPHQTAQTAPIHGTGVQPAFNHRTPTYIPRAGGRYS